MSRSLDHALLGLLALLWGASYLFVRVAVIELPPVTLIALRVAGAAVFLGLVMAWRRTALPRGAAIWGHLLVQALFNSIGAWTVLAWGQQYVGAGLAAVLNSTSPLFVVSLSLCGAQRPGKAQIVAVVLGILGVGLIVGSEALAGAEAQVLGLLACLAGAAMYAGAALYGRHFAALPPLATAAGTMIWASVVLVPAALVMDRPWELRPSAQALASVAVLSVACTGIALLIYFRLVRTLGPLGVASQSYLRAGVGLALGALVLGERPAPLSLVGLVLVLASVVLILRRRT